MKCTFQLNISFSCSRLSDVKIEFSPIAHTFKAYGFQPFYPMVTIIMTTITLVDIFLSKFSLDESQIHANAMSRIKWLFNFLVKRTFSLTFRLFARGFQMEKGISFYSGNLSPEKLKQNMVNETRIVIQKIKNETRISFKHTVKKLRNGRWLCKNFQTNSKQVKQHQNHALVVFK